LARSHCLLTGAVELLVVFIALEISSISTYILAGYRKKYGSRARSSHSNTSFSAPLPPLSFSTALRSLWRTGTTHDLRNCRLAPTAQNHSLILLAPR